MTPPELWVLFFFIKLFDLLVGVFFVVIAVFHFRELFSEQLRQEEGKEKKRKNNYPSLGSEDK